MTFEDYPNLPAQFVFMMQESMGGQQTLEQLRIEQAKTLTFEARLEMVQFQADLFSVRIGSPGDDLFSDAAND